MNPDLASPSFSAKSPLRNEIVDRVFWLIHLRYGATGLIVAVLFFAEGFPVRFSLVPQIILLFVLLLLNGLYHVVALSHSRKHPPLRFWQIFAQRQIMLDFIILTLQLHFSGGIENPFSLYYLFHTVFAGLLLPSASAVLTTLFGILLYGGLVFGECYGWFPHYPLLMPSPGNPPFPLPIPQGMEPYQIPTQILSKLIPLASSMVFMAYLTASIAKVIRSKEEHQAYLQSILRDRGVLYAKANRELKAHLQERERFLMMVEHELKSPLAAIQTNLEAILATTPDLSELIRERLHRSSRRIGGLLSLVQDLLNLSRLEQELQKDECVPFDFSKIIQDEIELIRPLAQEKNLELKANIQEEIHGSGTPTAARHLVSNLLSNAVRYTEKGGIEARLSLENNRICFWVKDTGIGIAPEEQEKIFLDFFRTQAARETAADGTGLGLSLVKRSVEMLGGTIRLDSQVGHGSRFTLEFPAPNI